MENKQDEKKPDGKKPAEQCPDHEHAWTGSWERPVKVDEKSLDPLTVARMTDHNVRGHDEIIEEKKPAKRPKS